MSLGVGEELSYQNGNGAACLSKVSSTHRPNPFNPSKRKGSVYCNLFFNSIPAMNQNFDALTTVCSMHQNFDASTLFAQSTKTLMLQHCLLKASTQRWKDWIQQRMLRCVFHWVWSRYLSWDDYFMSIAFLSAKRSKDPNRQVS